jgi:hypothetical protein
VIVVAAIDASSRPSLERIPDEFIKAEIVAGSTPTSPPSIASLIVSVAGLPSGDRRQSEVILPSSVLGRLNSVVAGSKADALESATTKAGTQARAGRDRNSDPVMAGHRRLSIEQRRRCQHSRPFS